jgi:hypothetical protein
MIPSQAGTASIQGAVFEGEPQLTGGHSCHRGGGICEAARGTAIAQRIADCPSR